MANLLSPGVSQIRARLSKKCYIERRSVRWLRKRYVRGHTDGVNGVALSGDGGLAISASWDQHLKIWDVTSGKELRSITDRNWGFFDVAMSVDVQLGVAAGWDHKLTVWNLSTGAKVRTISGHSNSVTSLALSGNGQHVISASNDDTLKVWNVSSGAELRTLEGHTKVVNGVALNEDNHLVASGSEDLTLRVWKFPDGTEVAMFIADSPVGRLAWAEESILMAGDQQGRIILLKLEGYE